MPLFLPIKYAIRELPQNTGKYIVVEGIITTGYGWRIIGDEKGLFPENSRYFRDINISGNKPISNFYSDDSPGHNKFICYGKYVYQPYDGVRGHNIYGEDVFEVEHWDILYPVQRDFLETLIPKNYICRYDVCKDKNYTFSEMLKGLYIWNYKTNLPEKLE